VRCSRVGELLRMMWGKAMQVAWRVEEKTWSRQRRSEKPSAKPHSKQ
jgi:hypothetical protein